MMRLANTRSGVGVSGLLALLVAAPAAGLVVIGQTPARSEEPPGDDPGWRNVGLREGRSAVYVGHGWVLTAAHVGEGPVVFDGVSYTPVPGSLRTLRSPPRLGGRADLIAFHIDPAPDLPALGIRRRPTTPGVPLLLMGFGQGRGEEERWRGRRGFAWEPGSVKRWGTNDVTESQVVLYGPGRTITMCFRTSFSASGTPLEAQGALGDSGGAVFARSDGRWKLAGLILAVERHPGQPLEMAVIGNRTTAADLAYYRPQIESLWSEAPDEREQAPGEPAP